MQKPKLTIEEAKNQLREYFLSLGPNTPLDELNELVDDFTIDKFNKKEIILEAGDFRDCVYFICIGIVRIYYVKEEKEITTWFIKENMVFAATYSLLSGEQNFSNYEALEDCIVLKIKYAQLEAYYKKYHSLEHLGRKMVESYFSNFMKRSFDVMFLSAEERYQMFVNQHPDLLNRVPLRYVASYLGLTQETLSRLRSKH
ncbi:MAG: Crp/Fnr family transcriptional regulator [Chitinophagales bacterium]